MIKANKQHSTFTFLAVPLLFSALGFAVETPTAPPTVSERFQYLEEDTPARTRWIRDRNHEVNEKLKKSPNTKFFEKSLRTLFDQKMVIQEKIVKDLGTLKLVDQGLGKPKELLLETPSGSEVLFSNFQIKKNNSANIESFLLSPNHNYVLMILRENGSTDQTTFLVYSLAKKKVLREIKGSTGWVSWKNEQTLLLRPEKSPFLYAQVDLSRENSQPQPLPWKKYFGRFGNHFLIQPEQEGAPIQATSEDGTVLATFTDNISDFFAEDETYYYFVSRTTDNRVEIRRQDVTIPGKSSELLRTFPIYFSLESIEMSQDMIFAKGYGGLLRGLFLLKKNGKFVDRVRIPDCCSIDGIRWNEKTEQLTLNLVSAINSDEYTYNLKTHQFDNKNIQEEMMTRKDLVYETHLEYATSADGTRVPYRITKKKGLKTTKATPVLMDVYGGFSYPAGFYPRFNLMQRQFIQWGGILVDPALRGGNEFGEPWHLAAIRENKNKTAEDLIAVSRHLVEQNITTPEKIIIKGTSNGGAMVISSALLGPKDFGLVIAVNGVHDFLRKDILDAAFKGWAWEYGDSHLEADRAFMLLTSPLEKIQQTKTLPKILVLNGRNDTRVHPSHSYKVTAALREIAPDQVHMTSLTNMGHSMSNPTNQDYLAWRANVVAWTFIGDHLGWDLSER